MSWLPKWAAQSRRTPASFDTLAAIEKRECSSRKSTPPLLLLTLTSLLFNIFVAVGALIWLQSQPSPADGVLTKSNRAVTFEADHGYDVPPRQPESLWEGLVPAGSGSVYITDAASFALLGAPAVDSRTSPSEGRYMMAMFHQLHCLAMLKYVAGNTFDTWYKPNTSFTPSHLDHCIDYLRQSIMCAGDVTLEPILPEVNNQGWGIKHQCRDFDAIQEFVTAHNLGTSPLIPTPM